VPPAMSAERESREALFDLEMSESTEPAGACYAGETPDDALPAKRASSVSFS
jgi:hypothetical protein